MEETMDVTQKRRYIYACVLGMEIFSFILAISKLLFVRKLIELYNLKVV